jgi:hypothetical protein
MVFAPADSIEVCGSLMTLSTLRTFSLSGPPYTNILFIYFISIFSLLRLERTTFDVISMCTIYPLIGILSCR